MPSATETPETIIYPTANRLWAEQLAMGLALLMIVLIFLALFHPKLLSSGGEVLGPNDMDAYGWWSILFVVAHVVVHEAGSLVVAWRMKVPLRFRFFGFGANAAAMLEAQTRRVWTDAAVGMAGPVTGTIFSLALHGIYEITKAQDTMGHLGNPLFLGMACVGYFYNLFTLIPILDLEGGWMAPALAPQAWLAALIASVLQLTHIFNLVLLCVFAFTLPRFVQLIRARAPRTDLGCTNGQRIAVAVVFIGLIIGLSWVGSKTFDVLPRLIRDSMGD